jgi:protocatechuate 3,4-dioxygenase beta subunit
MVDPIILTSPVAYPIPDDGPVGRMISTLNRHIFRPAHIHMVLKVRGIMTPKVSLQYVPFPRPRVMKN